MTKIIFLSLLAMVCINVMVSDWVVNSDMSQLHAENHFLENIQVTLLVLTTIIFLTHLLYTGNYHHFFALCGALFCFSSILRELDVETFAIPEILILLGSGTGKKIMLISFWILLAGYGVFNYQKIKPQYWRALLLENATLVIFLGGCLLIFGGLFDRHIIETFHYQLYEELLETNGYFLIWAGAIMSAPYYKKWSRDTGTIRPFFGVTR
ncbi:MAG: hypothetical protein DRQ48_02440 [Gammaproteobacteria bacterium]|nr:MAG: hypothetical protein DRQ58_02120 [Gammaproteobacteria bacterium]RKZ71779.1 MAG: hypothetical protein DRQ48_02440 [Gammaproteobacteria bacterium]